MSVRVFVGGGGGSDSGSQRPRVEEFARGRAPQTAEWIRKHPEYAEDETKRAKLHSAHYAAVADGLEPDTPKYLRAVEQKLGIKGPVEVSLTRREVNAAEDGETLIWNRDDPNGKFRKGDPIGREELARRKYLMTRDGQYNKLD